MSYHPKKSSRYPFPVPDLVSDACSGEGVQYVYLDDLNGPIKLSSPGYVSNTLPLLPNNVLCQWLVVAPGGMVNF